jgi:hypothetical protein
MESAVSCSVFYCLMSKLINVLSYGIIGYISYSPIYHQFSFQNGSSFHNFTEHFGIYSIIRFTAYYSCWETLDIYLMHTTLWDFILLPHLVISFLYANSCYYCFYHYYVNAF